MNFNTPSNYLCDPYGTGFSGVDFKRIHKYRSLYLYCDLKDPADALLAGRYIWNCFFRANEK